MGPMRNQCMPCVNMHFYGLKKTKPDRLFGNLFRMNDEEKNVTLYWLLIRFDHLKEPHGYDGGNEMENGANREKKMQIVSSKKFSTNSIFFFFRL